MSVDGYELEDILDKADFKTILYECDVLDIIDRYVDLANLSNDTESTIFEIRQLIKNKIETDAVTLAQNWFI